MFRFVRRVRGKFIVFTFSVSCGAAITQQAPAAVAADLQWQASATPSVVMAIRRTSPREPYIADFALTSPVGETRHAKVRGKVGLYAVVSFGEIDTPGGSVWGVPDAGFSLSTTGRWNWTCTVAGREVTRGTFMVSRQNDGHVALETTSPELP